ncbi:hypothetical protein [Comamonas sp. GB3 AK4-5]|uniref:hypothetical protein n=1 Tax=Comamonas sp. GB3 AK4-5 TaxID=3231487 RepID=UPI00351E5100
MHVHATQQDGGHELLIPFKPGIGLAGKVGGDTHLTPQHRQSLIGPRTVALAAQAVDLARSRNITDLWRLWAQHLVDQHGAQNECAPLRYGKTRRPKCGCGIDPPDGISSANGEIRQRGNGHQLHGLLGHHRTAGNVHAMLRVDAGPHGAWHCGAVNAYAPGSALDAWNMAFKKRRQAFTGLQVHRHIALALGRQRMRRDDQTPMGVINSVDLCTTYFHR